ncbi:hypothetical protein TNCV_3873951 [Trichonephila clavipes]|nr:hypothetical protein TNCV_3873951 [Trichonephila clavipes]
MSEKAAFSKGNKRASVFKDEAEVFKLLPAEEVVVEVRMGIGNKASFCIVGNIADVEGMVMGVCVEVDVIDDLEAWNFPFRSKFCESAECACKQLIHLGSRVQSVEKCPTAAHLEHVS